MFFQHGFHYIGTSVYGKMIIWLQRGRIIVVCVLIVVDLDRDLHFLVMGIDPLAQETVYVFRFIDLVVLGCYRS